MWQLLRILMLKSIVHIKEATNPDINALCYLCILKVIIDKPLL